MSYTDTPPAVSRMTYATPAEVRRMRKLRTELGAAQKTVAHALWIPLRTWQTWEAYGDRKAGDETGPGSQMYRVIWQAALALLEAHAQRSEREAEAQASRAALGLPPLAP